MNNLYVIYRISDKSFDKEKICNKYDSLKNAVSVFGLDNIYVLADNCKLATIKFLEDLNINFETTSNGNAGTCKYIFNNVINKYNDNDNLYLLEDDYLHLVNSKEAILEGLEIADYVTLYDHPDLYTGMNPFVYKDTFKSEIFLTKSTHWRSTISTTMTFAAKVKTLKKDNFIWNIFCNDKVPEDFYAFVALTKQEDLSKIKYFYKKGLQDLASVMINNILSDYNPRLLISALPGLATHTETKFLSPLIDWRKING